MECKTIESWKTEQNSLVESNRLKMLKLMKDNPDNKREGLGEWKNFPQFWIVPFLTWRCTRRCSYCYTAEQGKQSGDMSPELFSRFKDWCVEVYNEQEWKVLTVVWLGGEPLLITDKISETMKHINSHTPGVVGNLFTNADLIDSVNWDHLAEIHWINVNISDTPLEEIERRFNVMRKYGSFYNHTLVSTLDYFNLDRIENITRFFLENDLRPRIYRQLFLGNDLKYKKLLLKKLHVMCDIMESYEAKGYKMRVGFILDAVIPHWSIDNSPYLCGKSVITVHPDGKIGPCIRNMDSPFGDLYTQNPVKSLREKCSHFKWNLKRELPDKCNECESLQSCQGGCPNDKIINNTCETDPFCEVHKEIFPRLKALAGNKTAPFNVGNPNKKITGVNI